MKEVIYGFPCVENPHDFSPDEECCTPEEIAFWEDAKKRWDAGERDVRGARSEWLRDERGEVIGHVTRTSWGIGVSMVEMEDDQEESSEVGMTAEEIVKNKWPDAEIATLHHATPYTAYIVRINGNSRTEQWLTGFHRSPAEAWADAAAQIKGNRRRGE